MATRSRIGILEQDGSVTSIYCHNDGYVEHHGPILLNHYKTEEKVRTLISLGDISVLAEEIGDKHDFEKRPPGMCNVYGRDRGERDTDAFNSDISWCCSQHALAYIFDPVTSSWSYHRFGKTSQLCEALWMSPS